MSEPINDWYKQCEVVDKLTWQELCNKYSDISHERLYVLCLIAQALGVYEEARGKWQFLEYSEENQIFKKLGIVPDEQECKRFKLKRLKNKRVF